MPTKWLAAARLQNPWFTVVFLLTAVIVSFLDRQVITVLVGPIRADLGITDFQIGLLTGPVFIICYVLSGIPMGFAADRYHRPLLGGIGILLWSAATLFSGFSKTLPQLFAARTGVGVGEGTLGPISHSLLGDSFSKARLPVAISVYSIAGSLGPGLSLVLTAFVVYMLRTSPLQAFPFLHHLHQWQQVFIIVSVPGLVLAPIFALFAPEPRSRVHLKKSAMGSFEEVLCYWRARRRLIVLFVVGMAALTAATFGNLTWLPTLLMRVHGFSAKQMGQSYGVILMVVGTSGTVFWGFVASHLTMRGHVDGCMRTAVIASSLALPFGVLAPLMPDATWTLIFLVPSIFFGGAYNGLGTAAVQLITPPRLRARIASLYIATVSVPGLFVGPSGVGALTTYFFADDLKLGQAIALMSGTMSVGGVLLWVKCLKPFRAAVALAERES